MTTLNDDGKWCEFCLLVARGWMFLGSAYAVGCCRFVLDFDVDVLLLLSTKQFSVSKSKDCQPVLINLL